MRWLGNKLCGKQIWAQFSPPQLEMGTGISDQMSQRSQVPGIAPSFMAVGVRI